MILCQKQVFLHRPTHFRTILTQILKQLERYLSQLQAIGHHKFLQMRNAIVSAVSIWQSSMPAVPPLFYNSTKGLQIDGDTSSRICLLVYSFIRSDERIKEALLAGTFTRLCGFSLTPISFATCSIPRSTIALRVDFFPSRMVLICTSSSRRKVDNLRLKERRSVLSSTKDGALDVLALGFFTMGATGLGVTVAGA